MIYLLDVNALLAMQYRTHVHHARVDAWASQFWDEHGQRTVILRHGRPVAALGPVQSERPDLPLPRRPGGVLALLGALADWETLDADIAEVLAARNAAADRPPPEFD